YAAGFADQSHMTRHFKSRFGLTPRLLRCALRIGSGRTCSRSHRGTAIGGEGNSAFGNDPLGFAWDHTPRTTVNSASRPLRRIPAIVSFLNPQPALSLCAESGSSCPKAASQVLRGNGLACHHGRPHGRSKCRDYDRGERRGSECFRPPVQCLPATLRRSAALSHFPDRSCTCGNRQARFRELSVRSLASLIPRQAVLLVVGYLAPNLHRCPAFEARPLMCLPGPARLLPAQPPSHRPEYDSGSVPLPSLFHTRVVRQ